MLTKIYLFNILSYTRIQKREAFIVAILANKFFLKGCQLHRFVGTRIDFLVQKNFQIFIKILLLHRFTTFSDRLYKLFCKEIILHILTRIYGEIPIVHLKNFSKFYLKVPFIFIFILDKIWHKYFSTVPNCSYVEF